MTSTTPDRRICVIIPTYNNGNTVCGVIEEAQKQVADVIVVDDGSTDNTSDLLRKMKVTVVTFESNRGKGHALVAGFRKALEQNYTHAITIDADGQHFPTDIPKFLSALQKNPLGIIIGCRNLTEENMPRRNTFANKFSNFWFRLQTTIDLPDTQSGYRLYALSSLRGLKLITSRYEAELELLVFSAWSGVKISTVSVKVYYPPKELRVSHFRPIYDFVRISVLNTILCICAVAYGYPSILINKARKALS